MKIHHWIDKYNAKVSQRIITKYSLGIAAGRARFYFLNPTFWDKYLVRLLLVLCSVISFRKSAYKECFSVFFNRNSAFYSPAGHSLIYIKTCDIFATLFGFRYHVPPGILPLSRTPEILKARIQIATHKVPLVSLIIPVHNGLAYTYRCLKSIQDHISAAYTFEVIVVDDCSDDQTGTFFKNNTKGITYLKNNQYKGYSASCALGEAQANGTLVCFLNNGLQICNGWLEALAEVMKDENVESAGSKIIAQNGLLQEAGGIIYPDASIVRYGQYQNPLHPHYSYIRETDYCAVLMFRKSGLRDIDQPLNKKIIYQPLAQLIDSGYHSLLNGMGPSETDKHIPFNKWKNELQYPGPRDQHRDARKHQTGKTILFIDDVVLAPDQDSGSNRLFKIMKIVRSLGYHVIFMPNDGKKRGHYFDKMVLEGFEVLYAYPNRKGMLKVLADTLAYIDIVWACKPHNNEYFKYILELKKDCLWIYDTIDLHFLRLQREGELNNDKHLLQLAAITKTTELSIARKANMTIAITPDEKVMLNKESIDNVVVIPNIHEQETLTAKAPGFAGRSGILFIGGYIHKPNIDAAEWLAKQIMPEVWKTDPSIKLTLLGSNPPKEVLDLGSDRILVPGYIHDVSSYFLNNRLFVAPLRFGAGMKGKIGQSLEFGLPIVSTHVGIEGMNLTNGHDVLVSDDTLGFAAQITQLYNAPELWNTIRGNSINAIAEYTPERVTAKLKELFETLNSLNQDKE